MYIPTWVIIAAVLLGIYYYVKSKKQTFSYKLDIYIAPDWYRMYKKLYGQKSEKEFEDIFEEKLKKLGTDYFSSLWGRQYYFTEYYDSASGLTSRFQRVAWRNGNEYFYAVNEFGDRGFIFDSDRNLDLREGESIQEYRERDVRNQRLSVEIGENFVRNEIFDKLAGGPRDNYEKENYIFSFPLYEVFNFLFTLGHRFHGAERKTIVKWPGYLEKIFEEAEIKYVKHFEQEPTLFDIEKSDKDFFERIGRPKISLYSYDRFENAHFEDKNGLGFYYGVEFKIFRPDDNDRINEFPPKIK